MAWPFQYDGAGMPLNIIPAKPLDPSPGIRQALSGAKRERQRVQQSDRIRYGRRRATISMFASIRNLPRRITVSFASAMKISPA